MFTLWESPMKKLLGRLLIASFVVGCLQLTGCEYRSKQDTYFLVAANLKNPYWKTLQEGFNDAADRYGVTARVVGPDTYDPAAEADAFSKAVAVRPAGILVSVADAAALRSDIAAAINAGIPVITVDSDAPLSARLYFIGTNNLEAGHTGAARLVEKLHGKGNVVFYSIPGQPNLDERLKGYTDILNDSPGIKMVDVVATKGEYSNAYDRTKEYVARTGKDKIDAFVALESSSGKAVAEVLKHANVSDRVVIAMDVDPDTLDLINQGLIDSTVSQKPYTMGYVGLKALDDAHHMHVSGFRSDYSVDSRSPFPAFVDTGSALITKDNASMFQHPETH
jgi:ribose transport system substrate-binding protein